MATPKTQKTIADDLAEVEQKIDTTKKRTLAELKARREQAKAELAKAMADRAAAEKVKRERENELNEINAEIAEQV